MYLSSTTTIPETSHSGTLSGVRNARRLKVCVSNQLISLFLWFLAKIHGRLYEKGPTLQPNPPSQSLQYHFHSHPCPGAQHYWSAGDVFATYPFSIHATNSPTNPGYNLLANDHSSIHVRSLRCSLIATSPTTMFLLR
jgi:hypothetical protein